jgi:CRP-like cAMP-binding protein
MVMEEALRKYITAIAPLSDREFMAVFSKMRAKSLLKKELLVKEGEHCNKLYFYQEGYFRFYYVDQAGREITSDFLFAPGFISSYTSFLTERRSLINVQAMNDIEMLELDKNDLFELYKSNHNVERIGRLMAEQVLLAYEEHLFLVLNQPADMRYKILLEKYPKYVREIPLQYIASFLGITQETLSRIRRSI